MQVPTPINPTPRVMYYNYVQVDQHVYTDPIAVRGPYCWYQSEANIVDQYNRVAKLWMKL